MSRIPRTVRTVAMPILLGAAALCGPVPVVLAIEPAADVAAQRADFVPGEAIVRFEPGTSAAERSAAREASGVDFDRSVAVARAQVVEVDGGVASAVERLERQPDVAYAQPNYRYEALALAPNDTFFASLWGLQDSAAPNPGVNVLSAWDTTRGAGQVIAVLDTGVALDHPDIDLWDGGPGGTHGFDFVDDDPVPDDYAFHGTHVAGTAAAIDGNGIGVAGVAPDAEVMAVRVLDGDGSGSTDDIAAGIDYAVTHGADVINMSLGGPSDEDQLMSDAVSAADAADVVVAVAAGNDTSNNDVTPTFPCTLPQPNLICVAAVNQSGGLASFSNYGATTVDVGAPGTGILSAETDYKDIPPAHGLDSATGWTIVPPTNGGIAWSFASTPRTEGTGAARDSPGNYGQAVNSTIFAQSTLVASTGISLAGQTGCRIEFDLRHELEPDADYLRAGATNDVIADHVFFTGSSEGSFFREAVSISALDGLTDVKPRFTLLSDASDQRDGVYVDDLGVLCRDGSYSNAAPPAGNYHQMSGTSMATPHVAGVAALVGAADPTASDTEIVAAIKAGGAPLASLAGKTVTGRTVDANGALAAALGISPVVAPPQLPPPVAPAPVTPLAVARPPARPDLSGARTTIRVSPRRTFAYSFRAAPGLVGDVAFQTRRKAVVSRRAQLLIGVKHFRVTSGGKVTIRLRLSRRKMRILRRNERLLLEVTAIVQNAADLTAGAKKRLTLLPPKR